MPQVRRTWGAQQASDARGGPQFPPCAGFRIHHMGGPSIRKMCESISLRRLPPPAELFLPQSKPPVGTAKGTAPGIALLNHVEE